VGKVSRLGLFDPDTRKQTSLIMGDNIVTPHARRFSETRSGIRDHSNQPAQFIVQHSTFSLNPFQRLSQDRVATRGTGRAVAVDTCERVVD